MGSHGSWLKPPKWPVFPGTDEPPMLDLLRFHRAARMRVTVCCGEPHYLGWTCPDSHVGHLGFNMTVHIDHSQIYAHGYVWIYWYGLICTYMYIHFIFSRLQINQFHFVEMDLIQLRQENSSKPMPGLCFWDVVALCEHPKHHFNHAYKLYGCPWNMAYYIRLTWYAVIWSIRLPTNFVALGELTHPMRCFSHISYLLKCAYKNIILSLSHHSSESYPSLPIFNQSPTIIIHD